MPPRKYKTFTKAFKEEAVRLLEQSGRPAAEIARVSEGYRTPLER